MQYMCKIPSPLGLLYVSSDGENITGLWIEEQKYFAATIDTELKEKELPIFEQVKKWLDIYFTGKNPDFSLPVKAKGTEFRQSVWNILQSIPYGETMTYGEIAKELEKDRDGGRVAAQAVGGAVGHNPISIIVPCHRVVGSNGSLTGFASGIDKKIKLLELENAMKDDFFIPKKGTAL